MTLKPLEEVFDEANFSDLKLFNRLISINSPSDYDNTSSESSTQPSPSYWAGKRILVTGSEGMVGSTIIDKLIALKAEVHGTVKRHANTSMPNIQHNIDSGNLKVHDVNLCDYGRTSELIKQINPEAIFHQAAESFVPTSLNQPSYVVENNCVSTTNILEAATKHGKSLKGLQLACSSEQYGFVKDREELPIVESAQLRPTSVYAATKVFTEYIAASYHYMYKTPTIITRSFNQEGPRRGSQFFTARIAQQIADIKAGRSDKLVMGNPNAVRDLTHIHDSSTAQILSIEHCDHGTPYNICSGRGITTGDYAKLSLKLANLNCPIFVDTDLLRAYERKEALFDGFIGSNRKFKDKTGWHPTKTVKDIILDSISYREGCK